MGKCLARLSECLASLDECLARLDECLASLCKCLARLDECLASLGECLARLDVCLASLGKCRARLDEWGAPFVHWGVIFSRYFTISSIYAVSVHKAGYFADRHERVYFLAANHCYQHWKIFDLVNHKVSAGIEIFLPCPGKQFFPALNVNAHEFAFCQAQHT